MHHRTAEGVQGGLFLIGLALLFFSGWFWPGILVLVGLTALFEDFKKGRPGEGLGGMVFMCGLALLFASDWFWPGILVLLGIMAILSPLFKR